MVGKGVSGMVEVCGWSVGGVRQGYGGVGQRVRRVGRGVGGVRQGY